MFRWKSKSLIPKCSVIAWLTLAGGAGSATFLSGCGAGSNNVPSLTTTTSTTNTGANAVVNVVVTGPADTRLGGTAQFTAAVTGTSNTAVTWMVNGTAGGSATDGTISATGLYTAPTALPSGNSVTVSAASQATSSASGTLSEAIWNPVPTLSSAAATQTGANATTLLIDVQGSSFVPGAEVQVGGVSVPSTYVSATELQATVPVPSGTTSLAINAINPNPGSTVSAVANVAIQVVTVSVAAAARLLDQATFGPTLTDIQHVQNVGMEGYLAEQFAATPSLLTQIANPTPATCPSDPAACMQGEWWQTALTGPDQLRQRVAFALSEMFVVSSDSVNGYAFVPYHNMLLQDAFGNFATIMNDVTLSPAMGAYLNMLDSNKPGNGQIANENFAREMMQLFTIGIDELNPDGSLVLDASGNPVPNYTQTQVQAFARAYTGWTYALASGAPVTKFPNYTWYYDAPMVAVESAHDTSAKTLLNGTTLPAGQTAEQDVAGALANLFAHPNVGPFVCRQLIQHLVTSAPSPAYVQRVAAVFADNGNGVRGDMQAVVRAILMDSEARAGDSDPTVEGGHLREPVLYLANVMRGLGYTNTDPNGYYGYLSNFTNTLSEKPYSAGSVFNFFPPNYVIPGTTLNAPEFSLENTASAVLRLQLANNLVYNKISGFSVDLSATSALGVMAANPGNLVDSLGIVFMHGQMPDTMRTAIVNHISTLKDMGQRARVATYLVITSSQYKIEH